MSTLRGPLAGLCMTFGLALGLGLSGCNQDNAPALIASGQQYAAKKDYKEAVIQFKSALQRDPQSAEARYGLALAELKAGDPADAQAELSRLLDQKYPADKVMPPLSRAMLLAGDHRKLTTLYGGVVLADKPAMAEFEANVATAWALLGNQPKTEAAIATALAAQPDFGPARILQARLMAGRGELAPALALVERVLAADGTLYEAWHLKGEILLYQKDDKAGAAAAFRKALAIEPAYLPSHIALVGMAFQDHDLAAAQRQVDQLHAVLPRLPQTYYVQAQLAFAKGDFKKARDICQQLLRFLPDNVFVLQLAGAAEGQLGSLVVAEADFQKALQINPQLTLPRRQLALVYLRLGQPARAREMLAPLAGEGSTDAQALALDGQAALAQGQLEAAQAYFERAARIKPDDVALRTALALSHLATGSPQEGFAELETMSKASKDLIADQAIVGARLRRGEVDAALQAVDAMDRKSPNNVSVAELRGRVQLARHDLPAARAAFSAALKLDPALFSATLGLAQIDLLENHPDQAQARLQASIDADPRNYYARLALANLRLDNGGTLDEAKAILAAAIKASPTAPTPRLALIDLTLKRHQYKDALAAADDASAVLPDDLNVLDAAGRAQMEAGNVEQAANTFRRLANLSPQSAMPYTRLADIYRASGKRAQAEVALKKALELQPDLTAVQGSLVDLLLADGRGAEAVDFARRQQRARPKEAAGYLMEASVQLRLKAPDAAIAAYRAGLALQPDDSSLARALFKALRGPGKQAEGERFADAWMKAHPADSAFEYEVAMFELVSGELGAAEAHLSHVVALNPDNLLGLNNLAWVLSTQGKPGGVALAERAIAIAPPGNATLLDTLAMALAVEKRVPEALATERKAVALDPKNNGLRLNLARIALQAGDKTLARTELERLQALGASFAMQSEVSKLAKDL